MIRLSLNERMRAMKLEKLATRKVVTLKPSDSLDKAISLMDEHRFHHLPVVRRREVVGMISDRDLLLAVGWQLSRQRQISDTDDEVVGPQKVEDVMSRQVHSLGPEDSVFEAARVMLKNRISAVTLMHDNTLLGIITKLDLLTRFRELVAAGSNFVALRDTVAQHMRANVFTARPKDPIHSVVSLMREKRVRHLPVVAEDLVIGIITDRDIRRAFGCDVICDQQAQGTGRYHAAPILTLSIMNKDVQTIAPDVPLLDAADLMIKHRICALPVVNHHSLVGIITDTDIIRLIE